jgi:hypothetical protein
MSDIAAASRRCFPLPIGRTRRRQALEGDLVGVHLFTLSVGLGDSKRGYSVSQALDMCIVYNSAVI